MSFSQRLAKYKKETDYFAINLFHNSERPYKTIHDLTWQDALKIKRKVMKDDTISGIDIDVADWDAEDDYLFKTVVSIRKLPYEYSMNLEDFGMKPIKWNMKGVK